MIKVSNSKTSRDIKTGNNDKKESFLNSFNRALEKGKEARESKTKESLKEESSGNKDELKAKESSKEEKVEKKPKVKDYSDDFLNLPLIMSLYSEEVSLETEIPLEKIESILGELNLDSLLGDKDIDMESLIEIAKLKAGLALEDIGDIKVKLESAGELSQENFHNKLMELENKLIKASGQVDLGEKIVEKISGIEKELVSFKDRIKREIPGLELGNKSLSDLKADLLGKKENLDPALLEELKNLVENSKFVDLIKKLDGKDGIEESLKDLEGNIGDLGVVKPLEEEVALNRFSSSMLGLEKTDEILDTRNIQRVEDSMIKFMKVSKEGDTSVMRVKLYPEELGSIDISLKLHEGKIIADILVASEKVRELFLNSSSILNRNLLEQNISLKDIKVSVNNPFTSFDNLNDQGQEGQGKGNFAGQARSRNMDRSLRISPIDSMRIEEINRGSRSLNILA